MQILIFFRFGVNFDIRTRANLCDHNFSFYSPWNCKTKIMVKTWNKFVNFNAFACILSGNQISPMNFRSIPLHSAFNNIYYYMIMQRITAIIATTGKPAKFVLNIFLKF